MLRKTPRRRRGFTLVELLVAIALMTILTGSVVFIFIQAQKIFVAVDAKVQVYQYARYAFDQMERDLANVIRTRNMEFFNDAANPRVNHRYDGPSEAIPIEGTGNLHGDPAGGNNTYNHSFTLRQPTPYTFGGGDPQRWDSVYFKTVTVVDDQTQAALIEYALVDTNKPRPKLQKRVWRVTGVDSSNQLAPRYEINNGNNGPVTQDLCLYTVDAQFEIFVRNHRRDHAGDYYSAAKMIDPPRHPITNVPVFEKTQNWWGRSSQHKMIQTYYNKDHLDRAMSEDPAIFRRDSQLLKTQANFTFPMLKEGDKIFLVRNRQSPNNARGFKPKAYTIKAFVRPGNPPQPWTKDAPASELRIQFEEKIEGLSTTSDTWVNYMAAWIPPAVRVTLRIKDSKSLEDRSVSRVFKIMGN